MCSFIILWLCFHKGDYKESVSERNVLNVFYVTLSGVPGVARANILPVLIFYLVSGNKNESGNYGQTSVIAVTQTLSN
jgi:hypothetical protein